MAQWPTLWQNQPQGKPVNLDTVAQHLRQARTELLSAPPVHGHSLAWSARLTRTADEAWQQLYAMMAAEFPTASRLAVIATGGYGRGDLAPFSDLDVALVPPARPDSETENAVRWLFRQAQAVFADACGLQLGYAYRPVSDVPGFDAQTLSSLIDARFVAGVPELYEDLEAAIWAAFPVGEFVVAKRDERELQMSRSHATPLVVEPHLKLGAGGLRCVQTARLIRAALGERLLPLPHTYETVHQARVLLHTCAQRNTDELTRSRLEQVAAMIGHDPQSMASALAGAMEDNHDLYLDSLERLHDTRFSLSPGIEVVRGEARPLPFATVGQACVGTRLAMQLDLRIGRHWGALDPAVGSEVVDLLTPCEDAVRVWHKCGLLTQVLPELERCHTMVANDASHRYTVYEHTLQACRLVDQVSANHPVAEIKAGLPEPGLVMLALLLHDVGKADRRAPHSETGARMAAEVCHRWGIDRQQAELVVWLVREHLTMSKFARLRDVELPETIEEFRTVVQTRERLDALTVMTWADIQAVAAHAWSPIQESFLMELYRRTAALMDSDDGVVAPIRPRTKALTADQREQDAFLESMPPHYLISVDKQHIGRHMAMVASARQGEVVVEPRENHELKATELTVCCRDAKGHLSRILGVLYAHDTSLVSVRAATNSGDEPCLLDVFTVQAAKRTVPHGSLARIISDLQSVLTGTTQVEDVLRQRGKDPDRPQRVLQVDVVEGDPAIIEVRAPKGRGMPYRVSRVITLHGWDILAARVGQWAGTGTAAFYVKSDNGPVRPADAKGAFHVEQV